MRARRDLQPSAHPPSVMATQTPKLAAVSTAVPPGVKGSIDIMLALKRDLPTTRALRLTQWKTTPCSIIYTVTYVISFFTLKQLTKGDKSRKGKQRNWEMQWCVQAFTSGWADVLRGQWWRVWVEGPDLEGWIMTSTWLSCVVLGKIFNLPVLCVGIITG